MSLKEKVYKGIVGGLYHARWNRSYAGQDAKLPIEMHHPWHALCMLRQMAGEHNSTHWRREITAEQRAALWKRMEALVNVIVEKKVTDMLRKEREAINQ